MAAEPQATSTNYNPGLSYTPPVGRLPILGKVRAEIDKLRAEGANELNQILVRNAAQVDSHDKITADIAALQVQTDNDTTRTENDTTRTVNETNKTTAEVEAITAHTANENTQTADNTTKIEGELQALQDKTAAEVSLLNQKTETELAQVSDTISTGAAVVGVIGKQKNLFQKQTDGFDRDAEQKLAKIYVDTWSVRQTTDGDLTPSTAGLDNTDIHTVLAKARAGIQAT